MHLQLGGKCKPQAYILIPVLKKSLHKNNARRFYPLGVITFTIQILRNDFLRFAFASIGATIDTTKGYLGEAENIMSICMLKPFK